MTIDINAEIAIRRQEVMDQLNDANPNCTEQMVEIFEDEISMMVDTMTDNFDEIFHDTAIALNTYSDLSEADEETVFEWQQEMMNRMIRRWQQKVALREIDTATP